ALDPLENALPACQDVVQGVLEMGGRLGELLSDLFYVLLIALLDLFLEALTKRSVSKAGLPLLWMVGDHVGHQRPREAPRLHVSIMCEERIDRASRCRRSTTLNGSLSGTLG